MEEILRILWKKEKIMVTSIFSFSHIVFNVVHSIFVKFRHLCALKKRISFSNALSYRHYFGVSLGKTLWKPNLSTNEIQERHKYVNCRRDMTEVMLHWHKTPISQACFQVVLVELFVVLQ